MAKIEHIKEIIIHHNGEPEKELIKQLYGKVQELIDAHNEREEKQLKGEIEEIHYYNRPLSKHELQRMVQCGHETIHVEELLNEYAALYKNKGWGSEIRMESIISLIKSNLK